MNQRGKEPMEGVRIRIPVDLKKEIEAEARDEGISNSEFMRLAIEYVLRLGIPMASKTTWKNGAD